MQRPGWSGAAILVAAGFAGCSQPTDRQPYAGACTPLTVVAWSPDLPTGVPTNTTLSLTFSGYPDPDTVGGFNPLLSSGVYGNAGTYHVDLLTRTVNFQPAFALWPNLTYQITVFPSLHSLQDCAAKQEQSSFGTGAGPVAVTSAPPPTFAAAVLPIFAQSCGGGGCHRQAVDAGAGAGSGDGAGCLASPALALSLCDADAYRALVDVASREVSSLKLVAAGDSSRSYLLRKLLSPDPDGLPIPTTLGHRDPPGGALDDMQLRIISDWIDGGALP